MAVEEEDTVRRAVVLSHHVERLSAVQIEIVLEIDQNGHSAIELD